LNAVSAISIMPPRRLGSNVSLAQKKADELLRAASFLPSLITSLRSLSDIKQHYKEVSTLACSLGFDSTDTGVMRQLLLHTELPGQLCGGLAKLLQFLAAAETPGDADDPALAILGQLASAITTLFSPPTLYGDAAIYAAISAAVQKSGDLLLFLSTACLVAVIMLVSELVGGPSGSSPCNTNSSMHWAFLWCRNC
jgi:hypothetical protein